MIAEVMMLVALNGVPTYTNDAKPIFEKRCTPCHTNRIQVLPDLLDYDSSFKNRVNIKKKVFIQTMPPGNSTGMTDAERRVIIDWVNGGAKK